MAVFLTILKIIGIVLLSLIGLILLLLLLILFMPIHYYSEGSYDEENKPLISAKADWLFWIVRFRFNMKNKEKEMSLKVLWIKIFPRDEEEAEDIMQENSLPDSYEKPLIEDERSSGQEYDEQKTDEAFSAMEEKMSGDDDIINEPVPDESKAEEKEKISLFQKIKNSINKIKFKIEEICGKIKDGRLKAEDLYNKLSDERTKNAIIELWAVLKKFLWHIRPRKFSLYLHYGMDDPSLTGQIYGVYNSFYPIHLGKPVIVPDFDNKCLDGQYMLKGHIQLFFLLTALIRLYFNDDVKRLYSIIKNK